MAFVTFAVCQKCYGSLLDKPRLKFVRTASRRGSNAEILHGNKFFEKLDSLASHRFLYTDIYCNIRSNPKDTTTSCYHVHHNACLRVHVQTALHDGRRTRPEDFFIYCPSKNCLQSFRSPTQLVSVCQQPLQTKRVQIMSKKDSKRIADLQQLTEEQNLRIQKLKLKLKAQATMTPQATEKARAKKRSTKHTKQAPCSGHGTPSAQHGPPKEGKYQSADKSCGMSSQNTKNNKHRKLKPIDYCSLTLPPIPSNQLQLFGVEKTRQSHAGQPSVNLQDIDGVEPVSDDDFEELTL